MADLIDINAAQTVKIIGSDATGIEQTPVASTNLGELKTSDITIQTNIGIVTETAPATDIASSGLNGRLQRIAQRITSLITALGSPFQAGGSINIGNTTFGISDWLGSAAPTVGQKTYANSLPVVHALAPETYSASASAFVAVSGATDIFEIKGSATKIIHITKIHFTGTTTAGSGISISKTFIKRSTANTLGTFTTLINVPHDSISPVGTAVCKSYTANPILGTTVGAVVAKRTTINTAGTIAQNYDYDFARDKVQPIILRGVSQSLCINLGGAIITGPSISITVEWIEI